MSTELTVTMDTSASRTTYMRYQIVTMRAGMSMSQNAQRRTQRGYRKCL